jgi:2-polyprenyl-3-methyl-5-hydroxy-6-metoxy-1,4-benzoquinol methylase
MDKTKITIAVFDQCAKEYQDKFMEMDLYHESFDLFCESIEKENAEILEIACGPGNITKYLLKKRPDFIILGIDLSPKMIELAKVNNPSAEFQIMDCRDIYKINKTYDAVMCGFCLPYLSKEDSLKLIRDVSGLLKFNGVFYLSTMEDEYSKSGFKVSSSGGERALYIHYHQSDYLTKALKESGFEIIDLSRKDYPEQNESSEKDLIIISKKI